MISLGLAISWSPPQDLTVLGMNTTELKSNMQMSSWVQQDLNEDQPSFLLVMIVLTVSCAASQWII